ncbi:di-trans,poly-cis-decaprenylcistransferase [Candidatus Woesearchaeota archaeon B3_Woes]|nr:MAG: di-trans,poly-cis-decaprenylcistransferase [Candidatus Woesearchaeota archaeon B3_Woes]
MAILDKFSELLKNEEKEGIKVRAHHVAITTEGVIPWAENNKKSLDDAYKKCNLIIRNTIRSQIKLKIPILTIYVLPSDMKNLEHFSMKVDSLIELFNELAESEFIQQNHIKISTFGKWYDLPGRVVEPIKKLLDVTKDYDGFFVNFCINYNGQDEIVDACKILAMQAKTEKIGLDAINRDNIKSNIYASDFLPPDLIIKNGLKQKSVGLLLWDSKNSSLYFTKKLWPDFGKDDFEKAVSDFEKQKL